MGKTGKWLKNLLVGPKKPDNKEKVSVPSAAQTPTTPKEKKRWSFRRSSATSPAAPAKGLTFLEESNSGGGGGNAQLSASELESEQKKHALAVAAATAAAADAAAAAAQAAAAVMRLTAATASRTNPFEEEAAVKIQSAFRSYLARKALSALRGLVKLQALIRGHLVRKQATATLRCMEALVTVQARARVQRQLRMVEESKNFNSRPWTPRKSTRYDRFRHVNHDVEGDKGMEENIKIVEMDPGDSNRRAAIDSQQVSPAPSALTDMSPRTCSGRFEDYNNYNFGVTQSSPQCYSAQPRLEPTRVPFANYTYADSTSSESYPNYMAYTESSRAKVRSQSAPKQRGPESLERPPSSSSSRRRPSVEGRNVNNVPRFGRMQRSSSHVGSGVQNYHKPWSIKLDKSNVSLKDSDCGSNSTVLSDINYCRSLVNYSTNGRRDKTLPPFPLAFPHHAV